MWAVNLIGHLRRETWKKRFNESILVELINIRSTNYYKKDK